MGTVERLPRMFRRKLEAISTADPQITAVIQIQALLSPMSEEQAQFVIRVVCENLDINRRHRRAYDFED